MCSFKPDVIAWKHGKNVDRALPPEKPIGPVSHMHIFLQQERWHSSAASGCSDGHATTIGLTITKVSLKQQHCSWFIRAYSNAMHEPRGVTSLLQCAAAAASARPSPSHRGPQEREHMVCTCQGAAQLEAQPHPASPVASSQCQAWRNTSGSAPQAAILLPEQHAGR